MNTPTLDLCVRCLTTPATGVCCSAHGNKLCHNCYRLTHWVEVCVPGCAECAVEGLPVNLSAPGPAAAQVRKWEDPARCEFFRRSDEAHCVLDEHIPSIPHDYGTGPSDDDARDD